MWRTSVRSYKSNLSLLCHRLSINMQYYPQVSSFIEDLHPSDKFSLQYPHEDNHGYGDENISVTLHNQELWEQFHKITNEMM